MFREDSTKFPWLFRETDSELTYNKELALIRQDLLILIGPEGMFWLMFLMPCPKTETSFCFHQSVPSHSTSSISRELQVKAQGSKAQRNLGVLSPLCQGLLVGFISHSKAIFLPMKDRDCPQKYASSLEPRQDLHIGIKHCNLHICCRKIQGGMVIT